MSAFFLSSSRFSSSSSPSKSNCQSKSPASDLTFSSRRPDGFNSFVQINGLVTHIWLLGCSEEDGVHLNLGLVGFPVMLIVIFLRLREHLNLRHTATLLQADTKMTVKLVTVRLQT